MRLTLTIVWCFALFGCTSLLEYRTKLEVDNVCVGISGIDCGEHAFYHQPTESEVGYNIPMAVVEFDDQGLFMNRSYKNRAVSQIRDLSQDSELLMVVFAHGWQNNAAANNQNLRDFERILRKIATLDQTLYPTQASKRKVVGVYMGWRGLSSRVQPFKFLSFWNRKERAHRVGHQSAIELMADLAKIKSSSDSRLIAIGHSFGGALLYDAVRQQLLSDTARLNKGSVARSIGQLIVLVNPAFEAAKVSPLIERSRDMEFQKSQRPILAIFTSENDFATKFLFPFGRSFSTIFNEYRTSRPDQESAANTAIGHYTPYITHELTMANNEEQFTSGYSIKDSWDSFQREGTPAWNLGRVKLQRLNEDIPDSQKNNPYLNIRVAPEIIDGHNQIWGDDFMEFLYRFVAVQEYRRKALTRQ